MDQGSSSDTAENYSSGDTDTDIVGSLNWRLVNLSLRYIDGTKQGKGKVKVRDLRKRNSIQTHAIPGMPCNTTQHDTLVSASA